MNQPARHVRRSDPAPRRDDEAGARHLRVVGAPERSVAQRRRRARMIVVAGVTAAMTVMFGLVYMHVVMAQRQLELDHLTGVAAGRQTDYQALRLKVARLESPQVIISTAEGRLGMRQPSSVIYLTPTAAPAGTGTPPVAHPSNAAAPAGDADWPRIKAELAGQP